MKELLTEDAEEWLAETKWKNPVKIRKIMKLHEHSEETN